MRLENCFIPLLFFLPETQKIFFNFHGLNVDPFKELLTQCKLEFRTRVQWLNSSLTFMGSWIQFSAHMLKYSSVFSLTYVKEPKWRLFYLRDIHYKYSASRLAFLLLTFFPAKQGNFIFILINWALECLLLGREEGIELSGKVCACTALDSISSTKQREKNEKTKKECLLLRSFIGKSWQYIHINLLSFLHFSHFVLCKILIYILLRIHFDDIKSTKFSLNS